MIPEKVYQDIKYAYHYNHGAELKRGDKTYSLKRNGNSIQATLFVHCKEDSELSKYEAKGYEVYPNSAHGGPFAAKDIPLSQVPDSEESDWNCWDEY